ncbi:MerR family transcriptional regulator [Nitrosomonas sp.]|uniref:MerR family transcriptional regulator n=1 Tax=Nitrosomonas sp. TaxID=42353 RepID=UPI001D4ACAA1|nr:MerR family transcriptional regulator [Nitrosomonas sp.]MBX3618248.1 MerR family transcriptional regulator [Nitrosomonas sp.]
MENKKIINTLLPIPTKRYFTIGEVGTLCGVKPHVLRYWEQEFAQLRPVKRRGNRRYYQQQEVLLIHRIRELLYEQGFTINGARNHLEQSESKSALPNDSMNASIFSARNLSHIRQEINSIVSQLRS